MAVPELVGLASLLRPRVLLVRRVLGAPPPLATEYILSSSVSWGVKVNFGA